MKFGRRGKGTGRCILKTGRPWRVVDVTIVGGGMAGAITALNLLHRGVDARILERKRAPGTTLCGEGLSAATLRCLAPVFDAAPFIDQTFRGARWRFPGTTIHIPQTCHTMAREAWIPAMLDEVADRGGTVEYGVSGDTDMGGIIVGADGPGSKIRRLVPGAAVDIKIGHQVRFQTDAETPWLEFVTSKRFSPEYAWWFPRGGLHNIGILGAGDGHDADRLAAFVEWLDLPGRVVRTEVYPIATGGTHFASPDGRVLLIGDAAGLTNPLTKGGIAAIVHAAKVLADCVACGRPADYGRIARHPLNRRAFRHASRRLQHWDDATMHRLLRPAPDVVAIGQNTKLVAARLIARRPWLVADAVRLWAAGRHSLRYSW